MVDAPTPYSLCIFVADGLRIVKRIDWIGKALVVPSALLRHLKSIFGQGATDAEADALSHRLQDAKVIQVVGDLVMYP